MAQVLKEEGHWATRKSVHRHGEVLFNPLGQWEPSLDDWSLRPRQASITRAKLMISARMGEVLLTSLGSDFLTANHGRYVAISLNSKKVLLNTSTLEELNQQLIQRKIRENCFVARVGYKGIGNITK